jgi:ATP-dependent Clp protease ATP-binding subunit ClpC
MLLQVLDDGHMTDGLGRKVDFKNTIIIMTSNIGARQLADFGNGVGFGTKAKEDQREKRSDSIIHSALKKAFSPEFLNRVDDMIMFKPLEREHIHSIIDIELGHLFARIKDLGYKVKITPEAKDHICERGYDEKFGARPLKRAIQKLIEDPLAEQIVSSNLKEGDSITIDYKEGVDLKISIRKSRKK